MNVGSGCAANVVFDADSDGRLQSFRPCFHPFNGGCKTRCFEHRCECDVVVNVMM